MSSFKNVIWWHQSSVITSHLLSRNLEAIFNPSSFAIRLIIVCSSPVTINCYTTSIIPVPLSNLTNLSHTNDKSHTEYKLPLPKKRPRWIVHSQHKSLILWQWGTKNHSICWCGVVLDQSPVGSDVTSSFRSQIGISLKVLGYRDDAGSERSVSVSYEYKWDRYQWEGRWNRTRNQN